MSSNRGNRCTLFFSFVVLVVSMLYVGVACQSGPQPTEQPAPAESLTEDEQEKPSSEESQENSAADKVAEFTKDTVTVIRAARDIPAGTPVTQDLVTTEDVPVRFLPPNPLLKDDFPIYMGAALGTDVEEGAMILTSDFKVMEAYDGLSIRVPPGERALPVGFANLSDDICDVLRPGDRIDVVATLPVDGDGKFMAKTAEAAPANYATLTVLQNVTMLAIGSDVSGLDGDRDGDKEALECAHMGSVAVAVTRNEAELLSAAMSSGELMLMLRHPEDVSMESVERKTLSEAIESVDQLNEERKERTRSRRAPKKDGQIQIIRGGD